MTQILKQLRHEILRKVKTRLSFLTESMYFNRTLTYCDTIKYLCSDGQIVMLEGKWGGLRPDSVDNLPIESLIELEDLLSKGF